MATFPIVTLTQNAAGQYLQNDGLDTLGLTTVALSPRWANNSPTLPDFSDQELTLNIPLNGVRAPFRGLLSGTFAPASSTLAADITSAATTITIDPADANNFPSPANNGSVVLTLSNSTGTKVERVACTARSNNSLTVERGYDGTAKQAFSTGDSVKLLLGRGNNSVQFRRANGDPILQPCAVFRFHPEAVLRLERLMQVQFGAPVLAPVPWTMVVRGAEHYTTDLFFNADAQLPNNIGGPVSFHDGRGLIVDPLYAAALFQNLLAAFPGLKPTSVTSNVGDMGGIQNIAGLKPNTTLIHLVNMHGGLFEPILGTVVTKNTGTQAKTNIPDSGLVEIPANTVIDASDNDAGRLRWGWATNGVMTRTALTPPAAPNLTRRFFRVAAVDLNWALLGNRDANMVRNIAGADQRIASDMWPEVRDQVIIDYLADGPDTLAEATRLLANTPNANIRSLVSMALDNTFATSNMPGAPSHWPAFPAPAPGPAPGNMPNQVPQTIAPANIAAKFVQQNGPDVVVSLTGIAPFDAHVRIYPQQFVTIVAISEEPSFLRADGAANIALTNTVDLLLLNPFALQPGQQPPNPAVLTLDIVVQPRMGQRQMFGAVKVNVGAAPPPAVQNAYAGVGPLGNVPVLLQGFSASPLFGVPFPQPGPPPLPANASVIDMAINLAAEPSPRQAPRLPTMARFETLAVAGDTGGAPNGTNLWDAVVSGARWMPESRSAQHSNGNPGNPSGPDVHAPGVRVTGALAYDAALLALRRSQPMIPWPASTTQVNFGWVIFTAGDNFDPPSDVANTANTGSGVFLRTVAVTADTSQLAEKAPPDAGLTTAQLLEDLLQKIGINFDLSGLTINNEARLQKEIRREFLNSKHGLRDTQYSLLRALSEARELIYIESPQFARTAVSFSDPSQVDLVAAIQARLAAQPNLKVIICTPRLSDFHPSFDSWARQHYDSRKDAVSRLMSVARDRVAVFHPVGFPGRPAFVRTTSVIVDDVWALVGSTHFRRRGMTFDGSAAVASIDRQLEQGYSKKVRAYRRAIMALKLRVPTPVGNAAAAADWIRLERPESSFALVSDLLAQGGLGRIQPLWPGPTDNASLIADLAAADPDGTDKNNFEFMTTMAGVLNSLGR
jgi:hypothetical protein